MLVSMSCKADRLGPNHTADGITGGWNRKRMGFAKRKSATKTRVNGIKQIEDEPQPPQREIK